MGTRWGDLARLSLPVVAGRPNGTVSEPGRRSTSPAPLPARPPQVDWWSAVPAGRIGYDLSAPMLLLHSFQSAVAYQRLQHEDVLRGSAATVDAPEFLDAYRWMNRQLRRRHRANGGRAEDADLVPLWAWARTTRRNLLGQARWAARHEPGSMLLTMRVPAARVLLSRYQEWHAVLNRSPLWPTDTPDDGFDDFYERWDTRWGVDWRDRLAAGRDPALRAAIEHTWDGVFDLSGCKTGEPVQACLPEIHAADVIRAVQIKPTRRRRAHLPP
jgi:Domain of unknown function (DUF3841)